jgi:hypothetical protein
MFLKLKGLCLLYFTVLKLKILVYNKRTKEQIKMKHFVRSFCHSVVIEC